MFTFIDNLKTDQNVYEFIDAEFKKKLNRSILSSKLTKEQQKAIVCLANRNLSLIQNKMNDNQTVNISFEIVLTCGKFQFNEYELQVSKYILAIIIYFYCYIVVMSTRNFVDNKTIFRYFKFRFIFDTFWAPHLIGENETNISSYLQSCILVLYNLRQRNFFEKFDKKLSDCNIRLNTNLVLNRFKPYLLKLVQTFSKFENKYSCNYNAVSVLEVLKIATKKDSEVKETLAKKKLNSKIEFKNNLARFVNSMKNEFISYTLFEQVIKLANKLTNDNASSIVNDFDFVELPYKVARAFYLWDPKNPKVTNRYDLYLKMINETSSLTQIEMLNLIKQKQVNSNVAFFDGIAESLL